MAKLNGFSMPAAIHCRVLDTVCAQLLIDVVYRLHEALTLGSGRVIK
jgi:hypothetical protein